MSRGKVTKGYNLVQGTGEGANVIPVSVKTDTEEYFKKLIHDYRRLGKLDSRKVEIIPVTPLFS